MADTQPRHYIYGILFFMAVILGGMGILSEFKKSDVNFDSDYRVKEFNSTFNKFTDLEVEVSNLRLGISGAKTDFGLFGVLNSLISTSWQSLRTLFSSFSFMNTVINSLSPFFGIPAWIPTIIGLFITITIIFSIYSLIFNRAT